MPIVSKSSPGPVGYKLLARAWIPEGGNDFRQGINISDVGPQNVNGYTWIDISVPIPEDAVVICKSCNSHTITMATRNGVSNSIMASTRTRDGVTGFQGAFYFECWAPPPEPPPPPVYRVVDAWGGLTPFTGATPAQACANVSGELGGWGQITSTELYSNSVCNVFGTYNGGGNASWQYTILPPDLV